MKLYWKDLNFVGYSLGPRQPYEQLQLLAAYIHQLLAFSLSLPALFLALPASHSGAAAGDSAPAQ